MPTANDSIYRRLTVRRLEVLRLLAENRPEAEVAAQLYIQLNTVRSHVEDLKALVGVDSVRELSRWWDANRKEYLDFVARLAGAA